MYKLDKSINKKVMAIFLTSALTFGVGTFALEDEVKYSFNDDDIVSVDIIDDTFNLHFIDGSVEKVTRDELNNSDYNLGPTYYELANGKEISINRYQPIGVATATRTGGVIGMIGSLVFYFNHNRNNFNDRISQKKVKKYSAL